MCVLKGNGYKYEKPFRDNEALLDILVYIDFRGIFDRYSQQKKYTDRQKKAESMFRPEGIYLDFGKGAHRYLAFERSGSMSRAAKLSFIREDFYEPLSHRMMLDMHIGKCQLSKLYAYNGLMFTSGHRYEDIPTEDMEYMCTLIADYEEILKRARHLNIERKTMTHRNDIERILYARGQENTFTTDELYNLFAHYDMDTIAKFREDLTISEWHLMTEEEREIFLFAHLPLDTPREYFDLFADFRHGGYRVLGDIICDLDDAYQYEETRKHIFERKGDNFYRSLMINSEKLSGMDYDFKTHIARGCRTAINHEFDPDKALLCAIALGNRKFAFEVLPDMIEKYAKEVPLC